MYDYFFKDTTLYRIILAMYNIYAPYSQCSLQILHLKIGLSNVCEMTFHCGDIFFVDWKRLRMGSPFFRPLHLTILLPLKRMQTKGKKNWDVDFLRLGIASCDRLCSNPSLLLVGKVTRWVCEKIAQNVAQHIYYPNKYITFTIPRKI
jgi:hypothetical protein